MTKEEFDVLWALNAEGNYFYAKTLTESMLALQQISPEGDIIDIVYLINKYAKYIESWESKWKNTEERWIPRDKTKKNIEQFIGGSMYMGNFKLQERPNDSYLFGDNTKDDLTEQLNQFKAQWLK